MDVNSRKLMRYKGSRRNGSSPIRAGDRGLKQPAHSCKEKRQQMRTPSNGTREKSARPRLQASHFTHREKEERLYVKYRAGLSAGGGRTKPLQQVQGSLTVEQRYFNLGFDNLSPMSAERGT